MKFLVLDLDQTLIDDYPSIESVVSSPAAICGTDAIYVRPHLKTFLSWAFEYFEGVGIWTKASKEWLYAALSAQPLAQYADKFSFLYTGKRCSRASLSVYAEQSHNYYRNDFYLRPYTKRLKKIWRQKKFRNIGWNRKNTLIIDDQSDNFLDNYGNGILIPAFDADQQKGDQALLKLMNYVQDSRFADAIDVRSIDKRDWILRYKNMDGENKHPQDYS
jgi:HAD superfamily phosphatase (TIGR01681 family)